MRRSIEATLALLLVLETSAVAAAQEKQVEEKQVEEKQVEEKAPQYETPEACFAAMQKASAEFDYPTLLSCLSERDQKIQAGWMAFYVERELFFGTPKKQAAIELRKRYGMENFDVMGMMQEADPIGIKGPGKALEAVGGRIENRAQFMKEANDLLTADRERPIAEKESQPVLSDVAIEGETATGTVKRPGSDASAPIRFEKRDGSWVVASEGAAMK